MASFNKVFLIGNLTRDPELRHIPNGTAVTELGVACNRVYSTKDGERHEEVLFIDVTVWDRQAETCCQYLKKGRQVHVEGSLKMDTWDDKTTGEKRSKIKVNAEQRAVPRPPLAAEVMTAERITAAAVANRHPLRDARRPPKPRSYSNGPARSGPPPAAQPRRPAPEPEPNHDEDEDIPF